MGIGERDVNVQARKLIKNGCLNLSAMPARTSRSKGLNSPEAVRTWQTHAISSLEAAPASTVSNSWETGIGKLIDRIASDVLPGGRVATLGPLPGLEPRDVTSVWVGAALCVLLTDRAIDRPDDPVRQPAAYFRGMLNRAHAGELRLHNSDFGILAAVVPPLECGDPSPRR